MSLGPALAEAWNDQTVTVLTNDGKVVVGTLKGLDRMSNIILDDCHERIFSLEEGIQKLQHGLIILRGENVALIGETNREEDFKLELENLKAEPLKQIVH